MEINNINKNINNAPFFDMMNDDIPHNEYDNIKCKKNEIIYNDNIEEDNEVDNDVKNKLLNNIINKKELPVSKIFLFVIFAVLICVIIYIIINLISNRNDNEKKVKKNKNGKNECVESDSDSNISSNSTSDDDDAELIQNALKTKKTQHNNALQTDVPHNDNNSTQYIQHQQTQQHPIQQCTYETNEPNEQEQDPNEQEQNEDIDKKTQIIQKRNDLLNLVKNDDNNEQNINNMIMNKIGNLKISKLQKIDEDLSNYNDEDNESNNSKNKKKNLWQNNTHENIYDNCAIIETKKRGRPKKITELISENNE